MDFFFTPLAFHKLSQTSQVLLFGVDGNEVVRLPPSGEIVVSGVRPEDTMSVAVSPVADSLGIRTLLRSCSGAPCPGYNKSILVPRIDATARSCHIPQTAPGRITSDISFLYS